MTTKRTKAKADNADLLYQLAQDGFVKINDWCEQGLAKIKPPKVQKGHKRRDGRIECHPCAEQEIVQAIREFIETGVPWHHGDESKPGYLKSCAIYGWKADKQVLGASWGIGWITPRLKDSPLAPLALVSCACLYRCSSDGIVESLLVACLPPRNAWVLTHWEFRDVLRAQRRTVLPGIHRFLRFLPADLATHADAHNVYRWCSITEKTAKRITAQYLDYLCQT